MYYFHRVMVMDQGLISEYDNPAVLLQNSDSAFCLMAKDAGIVWHFTYSCYLFNSHQTYDQKHLYTFDLMT